MPSPITDAQKDVARLNRELARIDTLQDNLRRLESHIGQLRQRQVELEERRSKAGSNNLTFAWTDATTTLSWDAGYVRDHDGERVHHVPAGSRAGLTVNTFYWAGWNPVHQTMSFEANLDTLEAIPNIVIICRVQTGNGVDGTAGGGGSETATVGILNKEYAFVP